MRVGVLSQLEFTCNDLHGKIFTCVYAQVNSVTHGPLDFTLFECIAVLHLVDLLITVFKNHHLL